jgi:hypothetical protein
VQAQEEGVGLVGQDQSFPVQQQYTKTNLMEIDESGWIDSYIQLLTV